MSRRAKLLSVMEGIVLTRTVPAAGPSGFQSLGAKPFGVLGGKAAKNTAPPGVGVTCDGAKLSGYSPGSNTVRVPAAVPSVFHNWPPRVGVLAVKYSVPLASARLEGKLPALAGLMS